MAVELVDGLSELCDVSTPHVALMPYARNKFIGMYAYATQTIYLACASDQLVATVLHEFQHHLDELLGLRLGRALSVLHPPDFYERLEQLKLEVAEHLAGHSTTVS